MIVAVKSLAGLGGLPVDRSALSAWLRRNGIPTVMKSGPGGKAEHVRLSDLPEDVRLAYLKQQIETLPRGNRGQCPGTAGSQASR